MKAALYRRTGAAGEVFTVEDLERPVPGPGEVRVRVHVSGVNPTDWKSRAGATPRPIDSFQIPNHDGAGVIDAVGADVDEARVGERVWVYQAATGRRFGTAAEWTVVPATRAVRLPDGVSFELGASLGVPAMTAHFCLLADGPVSGKTVLVAGGAGAVGHFAVEIAKWAGARVVTTTSSEEKAALALAAGADLVVDYRSSDLSRLAEKVLSLSGTVDRIIEVAIGPNLDLDLAVSRPGTMIVAYAADGADPVMPVRRLMTANVLMRFVLLYGVGEPALARAAEDITTALEAGALSELPAVRFSLDQIAEAHDAVENHALGKVLVEIE